MAPKPKPTNAEPISIETEASKKEENTYEKKLTEMMELMTITMQKVSELSVDNNNLHKEMLTLAKENFELKSANQNDSHSPSPNVNNYPGNQKNNSKRGRPVRPTVDIDMDDVSWTVFLDSWSRFKRLAEFEESGDRLIICDELREACSAEVNKLLYEFVGADELNCSALTEAKLLSHVKSVAVRTIHPDVHCWNFNGMTQAEGEAVTRFVGRLKSQASLCEFNMTCVCTRQVSFANFMVSQRLTSGLGNPDHQAKLLNEAKDLDTLDKKVQRLVSLESTEEAQGQIRQNTSHVGAVKSQYRKDQRTILNNQTNTRTFSSPKTNGIPRRRINKRRRCRGCGKTGHGEGKSMAREDCPAYKHVCKKCGIENHFASVCEKRASRVSFAYADGDTSYSETSADEDGYYTTDTEQESDPACHASTKLQDFRKAKQTTSQR
tara:strand:- start:3949 stop:5256 length:1308 start_codon:yes stop_codon:yes gene_type:complete